MSFLEQNLSNDEQMVALTGIHWSYLLTPVLFLMFGLLFFFVPDIMIALWSISGIIFIYRLAKIKTTEYALTTKRVVTKDGIIKRNICETALNKIEGINVNQSVIGRMFDFGHLVVTGTGGRRMYSLALSSLSCLESLYRKSLRKTSRSDICGPPIGAC